MSDEVEPLIIHDSDDEKFAEQSLGPQRCTHTAVIAVWVLVAGLSVAALVLSPVGFNAMSKSSSKHDGLVAMHAMPCSNTGHNCYETKCCKAAGTRCYEKKRGWAFCKKECVAGPDPTDPHPSPWTCTALGLRTPGHYVWPTTPQIQPWVRMNCSKTLENCLKTRCCQDGGLACFQKNSRWAHCKTICSDGPDPTDADNLPWKCKQLGGRTPGTAPAPKTAAWVSKLCAAKSQNCFASGCCQDPGHTCFQKDTKFAKCEHTCSKGMDLEDPINWTNWTCKKLGGRTPGPILTPRPQKLASWVKDHCSDLYENCASSKCCKDEKMQCFEQHPGHAWCLYKCLSNHMKFSHHHQCAREAKANTSEECKYNNKTWTCRELGPRTLPSWGWPSLFCAHVMRFHSYEVGIVKLQLQQDQTFRGGIFACDQYAVYASDAPSGTLLGIGPYGPVRTRWFRSAPVWRSSDNTAANTLLFMNFWEAVRWDLQYKCCNWTIKADPDAVLLPDRLRDALSHRMGQANFITTCGRWFQFPLMFGAAEAISRQGLERYYSNENACRSLPWQPWGEDKWMTFCLQRLGVAPVFDGGLVGDSGCYGADCRNPHLSAFHPFKNANAWMWCYQTAMR